MFPKGMLFSKEQQGLGDKAPAPASLALLYPLPQSDFPTVQINPAPSSSPSPSTFQAICE